MDGKLSASPRNLTRLGRRASAPGQKRRWCWTLTPSGRCQMSVPNRRSCHSWHDQPPRTPPT
eukprot:6281089-Prorocentrum_lima.AAC.1